MVLGKRRLPVPPANMIPFINLALKIIYLPFYYRTKLLVARINTRNHNAVKPQSDPKDTIDILERGALPPAPSKPR
jgi:hypothetical protein